jgi:hypothetical protein
MELDVIFKLSPKVLEFLKCAKIGIAKVRNMKN